MKLWVNGKSDHAGAAIQATIKGQVSEINRQVLSRGVRAVNTMRNAELNILKGQRSGKVYKKPYTYGAATQGTKKLLKEYGHRLKGGQLYRASAPGEAPARRTGMLRLHWSGDVNARNTSCGTEVIAVLESGEKYAAILENGTPKMEPRPFIDKIKEQAMPEIQKIYSEPYT